VEAFVERADEWRVAVRQHDAATAGDERTSGAGELEAVDEQNPNNVALLQGPLALFAVTEVPSRVTRAQLLGASRVSQSADDWAVRTDSGVVTLRPFGKIMDEGYRLYIRIEG